MPPRLEVLPDHEAAAQRGAELLAQAARDAVAERGSAALAGSGGTDPWKMFEIFSEMDVPWESTELFQVDERVAPPGHADRNLTGLQAALLDRVPIPPGNLHPLPVEEPDIEAAAAAYAEEIRSVSGPDGALDVVHLGLGDDGHAASWPPGDPVVDAPGDVAVVGPFNGRLRMTLTPAAVNRAGWIVWLITGAAKAPVVARLLAGDPALPASRVRRTDATLLADAAAGADLTPGA